MEPINSVPSPQEQPSSTQLAPDDSQGKDDASRGAAILVQNQEQIDSLLQEQQKQLESLIKAGAGQPMLSLLLDKAQHLQELQAIQNRLMADSNNTPEGPEPPTVIQPQPRTPPGIPEPKGMKNSMSKLSEFSKASLE